MQKKKLPSNIFGSFSLLKPWVGGNHTDTLWKTKGFRVKTDHLQGKKKKKKKSSMHFPKRNRNENNGKLISSKFLTKAE